MISYTVDVFHILEMELDKKLLHNLVHRYITSPRVLIDFTSEIPAA